MFSSLLVNNQIIQYYLKAIKQQKKANKIKNQARTIKCNNNVATSKKILSFSSVVQTRQYYYVYNRELVTFMEHTVTIVTRQSAITDIQRVLHTRIPHIHTHTLKLRNIQSSYYIVDLRNI